MGAPPSCFRATAIRRGTRWKTGSTPKGAFLPTPAELVENFKPFEIQVGRAGTAEAQISVNALSKQILVRGNGGPGTKTGQGTPLLSEFPSREVIARLDLQRAIDMKKVAA